MSGYKLKAIVRKFKCWFRETKSSADEMSSISYETTSANQSNVIISLTLKDRDVFYSVKIKMEDHLRVTFPAKKQNSL